MLTAVGDFFKSTFGESLKKPLQPAGLFAAAIFVLLNIALLYPMLLGRNVPIAVVLRDSGVVVQTVLVTVVVLVLAYLLVSMSTTILKIMTGEAWDRSPVIARYFIKQAQAEVASRSNKRRVGETTGEWLKRNQRMTFELPDDPLLATPTALGNVFAATSSYLRRRYGIELSAVWGHMETVIGGDPALAARLNDEKSTLDFLCNLSFVLLVFAFEIAAVAFLLQETQALAAILCVVLAWIVYRAAVAKARTWNAEIRLSFDLYRGKLRETLGLPAPHSDADERDTWQEVSRSLLSGDADTRARLVEQVPVFTVSPNAVATLAHDGTNLKERPGSRQSEHIIAYERTYTFFVSRKDDAASAPPGSELYLAISDARVTNTVNPTELVADDADAKGQPDKWTPQVLPASPVSRPPSIVWKHTLPALGSSLELHYGYPVWEVSVEAPRGLRIEADSLTRVEPNGLVLRDVAFRATVQTMPATGSLTFLEAQPSGTDTWAVTLVNGDIPKIQKVNAARDRREFSIAMPAHVQPNDAFLVQYMLLDLLPLRTKRGSQVAELLAQMQPWASFMGSATPDATARQQAVAQATQAVDGQSLSTNTPDCLRAALELLAHRWEADTHSSVGMSNVDGMAWAWLHNWQAAAPCFARARLEGFDAADLNTQLVEVARNV